MLSRNLIHECGESISLSLLNGFICSVYSVVTIPHAVAPLQSSQLQQPYEKFPQKGWHFADLETNQLLHSYGWNEWEWEFGPLQRKNK